MSERSIQSSRPKCAGFVYKSKKGKPNTLRSAIMFSEPLYEALAWRAKVEGKSLSCVVRELCADALEAGL